MNTRLQAAPRSLKATALLAGVAAMLAFATVHAADAPSAQMSAHDMMAQHFARHVQEHLDKLAERLEIKASQQEAWQGFAAAFRDVMLAHPMPHSAVNPDPDAATIAREHADRAGEHAQALARLADATARLQQSLGANQKLVFNEAARHFAREHMAHGGAMHGGMEHGGYVGHGDDHCEGGDSGKPHHDGMSGGLQDDMHPDHKSAEPH